MSNYGASSSMSSKRPRVRVVGVPKGRCYCGSSIVTLFSTTDSNPCRRFYRCSYAAKEKLMNDDHVFKWVDEALLDEIENLQVKNMTYVKEFAKISKEREVYEQMVFDNVLVKIEKEIFERVKGVLIESSWNVKKMMVGIAIGCMMMIGLSKVIA